MSPKKNTQKFTTPAMAGGARESTTATNMNSQGFAHEERAVMKERSRELKVEACVAKAEGESDVLVKIAEMPEPDRSTTQRLSVLARKAVS
jgi:hypothetical protein